MTTKTYPHSLQEQEFASQAAVRSTRALVFNTRILVACYEEQEKRYYQIHGQQQEQCQLQRLACQQQRRTILRRRPARTL